MTSVLLALPFLAALIGAALGAYAAFRPAHVAGLVGIAFDPARAESISEVRATYGGVFLGSHAAAFVMGVPAVFVALGCAWGAAALIRVISSLADKVPFRANGPGIAVEIGMAGALIVPFLVT
ncbi:MAG: hypothetical protein KF899_10855 [Parvibaculum sp.]|nr:hypothetical protein [Parvibaculum sp.]